MPKQMPAIGETLEQALPVDERLRAEIKRRRAMTAEQLAAEEAEAVDRERLTQLAGRLKHNWQTCGLQGAELLHEYDDLTFEHPTESEACRLVKAYAARFPEVDKGLFLHGTWGNAKSHLMHVMVKDILRKRGMPQVCYANALDLPYLLQHDESLEVRWRECELLVLCDIEKVMGDKFSEARKVMRRIVKYLADKKRRLCATSNWSIAEHEKQTTSLGHAWASCLRGLCFEHQIIGRDRRDDGNAVPDWAEGVG